MVLEHRGFDGTGSAAGFCQEVTWECQSRGFSGAVLDFECRLPPLEQVAAALDEGFRRRGWSLYVPEGYAPFAPHAKVVIPSALSGGSLEQRLEEAAKRFGQTRTVLALQRTAEDFTLPAPSGSGRELTQEELSALKNRLQPAVFFSHELCARYFTYMERESGAHFVLFDDGDTLRRKVETAHRFGIHTFLAAWPELSPWAERVGVRKISGKM
jgi:hypothetical protein